MSRLRGFSSIVVGIYIYIYMYIRTATSNVNESRSLIPFIKSLTHFDISQSFLELGHMATGLTFFPPTREKLFLLEGHDFFFFYIT